MKEPNILSRSMTDSLSSSTNTENLIRVASTDNLLEKISVHQQRRTLKLDTYLSDIFKLLLACSEMSIEGTTYQTIVHIVKIAAKLSLVDKDLEGKIIQLQQTWNLQTLECDPQPIYQSVMLVK